MNEKAKQMIATLKEWHCPKSIQERSSEEALDVMIRNIYNEALRDCDNFIDVMISKNPEHRGCLTALRNTMFPSMFIGDETK